MYIKRIGMYSFKNDYSEGAHIRILQRLIDTNFSQQQGYGEDKFSAEAKQIIREKINNPHAFIYFVSGGTQTNLTVISSLLRVHEAVISPATGHIYANETGAIESVGHRVITVEYDDGKLTPITIETVIKNYVLRPHVVKPRLVYISNSTEIGTIYNKSELIALYECCQKNNLLLYMDGARLGHALMSKDNDLTMADLALYTDAFYIGGTKNGALLGEAIIFNRPDLGAEFDYVLKQKGALLAKGRLLGIQFLELFSDGLYFELASHANRMAHKMADALRDKGFSFLTLSTTNQLFPILPVEAIEKLQQKYDFYIWKSVDTQHTALRLITSWATPEDVVDEFVQDIREL